MQNKSILNSFTIILPRTNYSASKSLENVIPLIVHNVHQTDHSSFGRPSPPNRVGLLAAHSTASSMKGTFAISKVAGPGTSTILLDIVESFLISVNSRLFQVYSQMY